MPQSVVLRADEHRISRRDIPPGVLNILRRLQRAKFRALLVGGCVRDLLLARLPKDFDVVTDARPEQVRRLFPRSRIIGRRFRLVHVASRDGVIEVSTFRRNPDPRRQRRSSGLLVTSDNTYGTPREDAFRRDFTINALFYSVSDSSVIDYVDGLPDLSARIVRVIGKPDVRFQEDPVRMLRACEFAGRLGFVIEQATRRSIRAQRKEIAKASSARLTEELLQLLFCGRCEPAFLFMLELGLLEHLLPEVRDLLTDQGSGRGFPELLATVDAWREEGRELSESLVLSALLAPGFCNARARLESRGGAGRAALERLAETSIASFVTRFALSRARVDRILRLLWIFQRLCEPGAASVPGLRRVRQPALSEALQLFELLAHASGGGDGALAAWRELQQSLTRRA